MVLEEKATRSSVASLPSQAVSDPGDVENVVLERDDQIETELEALLPVALHTAILSPSKVRNFAIKT